MIKLIYKIPGCKGKGGLATMRFSLVFGKRILLIAAFFLCFIGMTVKPYAQSTWAHAYGTKELDESAMAVAKTNDGGYIVAGYASGANYQMILVIKVDSQGCIEWQKTYDRVGEDNAYSIIATSDGGYVVAGETFSQGGNDMWLLKLNASGTIVWEKIYGFLYYFDYAAAIQQTTDGGYIVAGGTEVYQSTGRNAWVLKLNASGNITWQKIYAGENNDYAYAVKQTSDGGYIVAGLTTSFGAGSADGWILKLNSNGNIAWQKAYGGSDEDYINSIIQTSDGNTLFARSYNNYRG
ncbi:MAG: hypothetical protein A2Y62_02155 [Candidatus Fischerbacteria bacterium RBG_13_37_8]|uniref:Bulb-type lectin domain-containing protein n=1 Tax=Candidatus Fischerbacteria bacterium RBG_13_37_8 TaxID=1817863 RepID=A0A1F5VL23_9BACT|nr:MAG: hypothetical protein A2Y62_02155 [Candidatus Fischerbacteria bacterium RBG_13_37_8]